MEIIFNRKERLETHIKALIKAYDKQIILLNKDFTKKQTKGEEESDEIKMTDSQIKTYSQGQKEAAETAEYLFTAIEVKIKELEQINSGEKPQDPDIKEEKPKDQTHVRNPMNDHIE